MPSTWPRNQPFALALSHDVDRVAKRWQYLYYLPLSLLRRDVREFRQHLRSLQALGRGDDPYWNFERIMAGEDALGVRSTFFFLNESGRATLLQPRSMMLFRGRYSIFEPSIRSVIRELHTGGWEVGLHGSFYSYREEALLRKEKAQLEEVLGERVVSSRQHYLNLDIPETWQIHARAGLLYDSTLGYTDRVGFRWGTSRPFYPRDPRTGEIIPVLQIPMAIMDGPLLRLAEPWPAVERLIAEAEAEGGVLTINWHQRMFNPWEFERVQALYWQTIESCQRRGAWIAPVGTIASWWRERHAAELTVREANVPQP